MSEVSGVRFYAILNCLTLCHPEGEARRISLKYSCHCEGAERPWQSHGSEAPLPNLSTARGVAHNGITTSCAAHTPRNDIKILSNPALQSFYTTNNAYLIKRISNTFYSLHIPNWRRNNAGNFTSLLLEVLSFCC